MTAFNSPGNTSEASLRHASSPANPIHELAECRLRRNPYLSMHNIRCDYDDGVLRLSGHVATYYLKQMAQEVVSGVSGVDRIDNHVKVIRTRSARK